MEFLLPASANHDTARALALSPPACPPRRGRPPSADLVEAVPRVAAAYVEDNAEALQRWSDPDRVVTARLKPEATSMVSTQSCGWFGNDRFVIAQVAAAYKAESSIGQTLVLLVLRKPSNAWQLLAASRDPISNAEFWQQATVIFLRHRPANGLERSNGIRARRATSSPTSSNSHTKTMHGSSSSQSSRARHDACPRVSVLTRLLLAALCVGTLTSTLSAQSRIVELNDTGWKLLQSGDADRAAKIFAEALETAPDPNRGFVESRVDRFRVSFQGHADKALAARATDLLESAFWRIGKTLGAYPSDPVAVMLYTEKQFRDITLALEWSGGIYDGRIRVPAAGAAQSPQLFERVLAHELTHAIIASLAARGIPTWLHEGLAQHFEGDDAAAARRRLKAGGVVVPLRYLEGNSSRLTADQAMVAYDQSLVIVDMLIRAARSIGTRSFERSATARAPNTRSTISG